MSLFLLSKIEKATSGVCKYNHSKFFLVGSEMNVQCIDTFSDHFAVLEIKRNIFSVPIGAALTAWKFERGYGTIQPQLGGRLIRHCPIAISSTKI